MLSVELKSLKSLEWPNILSELALHATSKLGKERIENLPLNNDIQVISKSLKEVSEFRKIFDNGVSPSIYGIEDIRESILKASKGSILSGPELLQILRGGKPSSAIFLPNIAVHFRTSADAFPASIIASRACSISGLSRKTAL